MVWHTTGSLHPPKRKKKPPPYSLSNNLNSFLCLTLAHQRIALVYFVVALIEAFTTKVRPTTVRSGPYAIFEAYRWQWYTISILPDSLNNTVTAHIFPFFYRFWKWWAFLALSGNQQVRWFYRICHIHSYNILAICPGLELCLPQRWRCQWRQAIYGIFNFSWAWCNHWNLSYLIQYMLVPAGTMWCEGQPGPSLQCSWLCW